MLYGAGVVDGATYFIAPANPVQLAESVEHAVVDLPTDYEIGFDITPDAQVVANWASIIHITATGNNCCAYGDRIPGIWFHPGTHLLHIRDGHGNDGNAGCDPPNPLPANERSTVRVEMMASSVEVFINDVSVCADVRADRQAFTAATVYAPDPWHDHAQATLHSFYLRPL